MTTAFVGIDPGKTGCAALWAQNNKVAFWDWKGPREANETLSIWKFNFQILGVALEDVNFSIPGKRGTIAIRELQRNIGHWEGLLIALDIDYIMPTPKIWKKMIPPSKGKDQKKKSLDYVKQAIPGCERWIHYKYHHNRAEALLLALYVKEVKRLEGMRIQ